MRYRACAFVLAAAVVSAAATGCRRTPDANATHEMPKLPPPPAVALGPVHIEVEIDGNVAPAIDETRLRATKPDFEDSERRAWRLTTLLGPAAARPGSVAEVSGDKGVAMLFAAPAGAKDPVPVLTQTRRGTIVAAMVDPADAFPPYHGQGRRMARPGDPLPRMTGVTKIRAYVDDKTAR